MPGSALLNDIASALDRSLPVSLSLQLKGLIEYGIACGELPAGARLPSVRELADAGGIAPMTAAAVYKDLRRAGLIVARAGSGTFVADGARPNSAPEFARIQAHLDAALAEAEALGVGANEVAALLSARIGRGRAREGRSVRILLVGVFEDATRAYAAEIGRQLKQGDAIDAATLESLRQGRHEPADIYVTLANRRAEVEEIVGARAPVTTVSFMPSEETRARLAAVDPLARVGLVSVFPEFLALMKPGVLRFTPHVRSVDAVLLDDPDLPRFLAEVDVAVYATGAQAALERGPPGLVAIEYRHVPDPHAVKGALLPLIESIRSGAAAAMGRDAFPRENIG
ncbi:GntR family transcriptional regulator [Alsobacter sp. KACC 23698]|uniref:GntR family transcriptional regulator n=1 Tax=Alsobacter sp. KACC 23698 TaxID=3149229 RepID=A0AAU7JA11_9HYPH